MEQQPKPFQQVHDWKAYKKEFMRSHHTSVRRWFEEVKGMKIAGGHEKFIKNWGQEKKARVMVEVLDIASQPRAQTKAVKKLLDKKFKGSPLRKIEKTKKKALESLTITSNEEIRNTAKLTKVSALKTLMGMVMILEQSMEDGSLTPREFLKFSPNIVQLIKDLEAIEGGEFGTKDIITKNNKPVAQSIKAMISMAGDKK
jgi:hypothetical protein